MTHCTSKKTKAQREETARPTLDKTNTIEEWGQGGPTPCLPPHCCATKEVDPFDSLVLAYRGKVSPLRIVKEDKWDHRQEDSGSHWPCGPEREAAPHLTLFVQQD